MPAKHTSSPRTTAAAPRVSEAAVDEGLWDRMEEALKEYEVRHRAALRDSQGRLAQAEIGRRVARVLGMKEPIPQPAVAKWFNRNTLPSVSRLIALATVLEVDPGWLVAAPYTLAPKRGPDAAGAASADAIDAWARAEVERMAEDLRNSAKGRAAR
jgi:transcriptional regulator with XRE-family HTH domain